MEPVVRTIHSFLRELAEKHPSKQILGYGDHWMDAKQVLSTVEAVAFKLVQLGLRSGDYVALRSFRTADTILMILGLQAIGAVAVLTDPRYAPEDFLRSCDVSIPLSAIIDRDIFTDKRTRKQVFLTPASLEHRNFSEKYVNPRSPAFVIFTSGSTGKSKAVMLSQYNLVNNLIDSHPLGYYTEDDIALGALPLDHVFGLVLLFGMAVLQYALYLPERTDIHAILSAIETQQITRMNGVPSLYLAMAERKGSYDLSSLRAGFIGGGPCTVEQFQQIEETLGMTLIPVYGMSECIGICCASYQAPQSVRANGVGPFYSMNTGKILLEDGSEAAVGVEGEICVCGPARMVGYYPDPMEETQLLRTGDLGYMDGSGIIHISGRKKDIIIRNGRNISARHIEQALLSIQGVKAAAVVGLEHATQGEAPWAMVVSDHSELMLLGQLTDRLAKNELPMGIYLTDTIPTTPSGKPDKITIRKVLTAWAKV